MNDYKGIFATFEGLDISGKSTQIRLLEIYLRKLGINVINHREPGGTRIGEKIREILLDSSNFDMSLEAEFMLFNSARTQYVHELLIPALQRGDVFLSDRFYDSTTAYQGYGRGLSLDDIKAVTKIITKGLTPDITFLLDITVEERNRRSGSLLEDRMESIGYEFNERVRNGYLEMAREDPSRIKVIDGMKSIEECHKEVKEYFNEVFELKFSKSLANQ